MGPGNRMALGYEDEERVARVSPIVPALVPSGSRRRCRSASLHTFVPSAAAARLSQPRRSASTDVDGAGAKPSP